MPESSKDVRLRLLVEAVDKASRVLNATEKDLKDVAQQADKVGDKTDKAARKGADALNRFQRAAKNLEGTFKKLETAGERMQNVGQQMVFLGAALTAAAAAPVAIAGQFERTMSKVQAISGATGDTFEEMSTKAKELGRTTRFTASQVAEGMTFLSLAGFKANEVISTIGPSLTLAAAGGLNLASAADIASNVVKQFSLQVSDLEHVTDAMANTAANTNTSVGQLAQALNLVGLVASKSGQDIDTTAAIIGVLGDAGTQASRAGTGLRSALTSLLEPTPKARKQLKAMGVEITRTSDGGINLVKTFEDLSKAGLDSTNVFKIFTTRAGPVALAIAENIDRVKEMTEANKEADGAGQKMAETMERNLGGALIELKSALEGVAIAIGEPLLEPLTKVAKGMAQAARDMAAWAEEHPKLMTGLVAVVGSVGALTAALGAILIPLGMMVKLVGLLGPALMTSATAISVIAPPLVALVYTLTQAYRIWKAFMGALEARDALKRSAQSTAAQLGLMEAKLRKFNRETGLSVKSMSEAAQAVREHKAIYDRVNDTYIRTTEAQYQAIKASKDKKEAIEEENEVIEDLIPNEEELEKIRKAAAEIALGTKRLRIQAIDDEIKKLQAQKALEIKLFKDSENAKIVSAELRAQRVAAIEAKYAQQIEEIEEKKKEQEQKDHEQKLERMKEFQEETNQLEISMMADKYAQLQAIKDADIQKAYALKEKEAITAEMFEERKDAIYEQYRQKKLKLDEEAAEKTLQIWDRSAGMLQGVFGNLYETTGRKVKAFFYLQKAIAIAQVIMDTAAQAAKVGAQTGIFGIPMQALVYAQGAARVAMITAQTIRGFAEGGQVKGKKGRDNIIARLTSDEFVMPVEAVKHYGLNVMEAMRRRAIEINDSLPHFTARVPSRPAYQEGGLVSQSGGADEDRPPTEVTMVNITDPREIDAFLSSAKGQNAIVNVISSQSSRVKRILR